MAEYDKFPKRYKVVRGNGNIIDPYCVSLLFEVVWGKKKQKAFIRKIELGLHLSWMGRISIGEEKENLVKYAWENFKPVWKKHQASLATTIYTYRLKKKITGSPRWAEHKSQVFRAGKGKGNMLWGVLFWKLKSWMSWTRRRE